MAWTSSSLLLGQRPTGGSVKIVKVRSLPLLKQCLVQMNRCWISPRSHERNSLLLDRSVQHTTAQIMHLRHGFRALDTEWAPLHTIRALTHGICALVLFFQLNLLKDAHFRLVCTEAQLNQLEKHCLSKIQAPSGLVKKNLFTLAGHCTAYDWIQFLRSYSKYILSQHFEPSVLAPLIKLIEFMKLLLTGHITNAVVEQLRKQRLEVARQFVHIPETDHAIVMHNLVFHLLETVERWGALRGYWCFVYERSV